MQNRRTTFQKVIKRGGKNEDKSVNKIDPKKKMILGIFGGKLKIVILVI